MRLVPCLFYKKGKDLVCGIHMLKWLLGLGLFMYAFLMIAGGDDSQQRAGLREVPEVQAPPVSVSAPVTDDQVLRTAATELVPMLPAPPIRVLPPKPDAAPAVQASLTQTRLNQSDDMAAMTFAPGPDTATGPTVTEETTLRWVAVERANVRSGASKTASITARIEQGEAVSVLWTEPSGWARVRIEGDGIDGYVHESLLTDLNPQIQ
jgi:hypothetical protein